MINTVEIKNFKSISDRKVEIHPSRITFLVGENAVGKSNILDGIAVLLQRGVNTPLDVSGMQVKFFDCNELYHRMQETIPIEISLGSRISPSMLEIDFPAQAELSPEIFHKSEVEIRWSVKKTKSQKFSDQTLSLDGIEVASIGWSDGSPTVTLFGSEVSELVDFKFWGESIDSGEAFFDIRVRSGENLRGLNDVNVSLTFQKAEAVRAIARAFLRQIGRVHYISTGRGLLAFRKTVTEPADDVGKHGESTIEVHCRLNWLQNKEQIEKINKWCREFGVVQPTTTWIRGNIFETRFIDDKLESVLPISVASYGGRQLFPVILQLFTASSNDIVLIEEPEISLHPKAQIRLADLLVDATRSRQIQIVVSTHSENLILSLRKPLMEKLVHPDDIAIYEVSKDDKGTKCERLQLEGKHLVSWVKSFREADEYLVDLYLEEEKV